MLDYLKFAMQRMILGRAVRKRGAQLDAEGDIELRRLWDRVHRIAVTWPGQGVDATSATLVLNRLRERFPEALVTVLALPGIGAAPPPELSADVWPMEKRLLNWLGLPDQRLRSRLMEMGFDTVIDLSPGYDAISAYYCLLTGARLRIGFAGQKSDRAFNYQVAPTGERAGAERYRVLAKYIG
ncbi:MAG: glycosyltransferase family 9 protein [Calditrichaeota bacterium]|nr:glycosyltransferase family 9 protein [Calditrichota bacterium]